MRRGLLLAAAFGLLSGCLSEPTAPVEEAALGEHVFRRRCAICHGADGRADVPMAASYPNMILADGQFGHGGSRDEIIRTISEGVPRTPMIGMRSQLSHREIEAVADHVLNLARP